MKGRKAPWGPRPLYGVEIAGDLRAAFYVEGQTVWSVDIGDHGIYRG